MGMRFQDGAPRCHCGKDGHALGSVNCPVHGNEATRPDRTGWDGELAFKDAQDKFNSLGFPYKPFIPPCAPPRRFWLLPVAAASCVIAFALSVAFQVRQHRAHEALESGRAGYTAAMLSWASISCPDGTVDAEDIDAAREMARRAHDLQAYLRGSEEALQQVRSLSVEDRNELCHAIYGVNPDTLATLLGKAAK